MTSSTISPKDEYLETKIKIPLNKYKPEPINQEKSAEYLGYSQQEIQYLGWKILNGYVVNSKKHILKFSRGKIPYFFKMVDYLKIFFIGVLTIEFVIMGFGFVFFSDLDVKLNFGLGLLSVFINFPLILLMRRKGILNPFGENNLTIFHFIAVIFNFVLRFLSQPGSQLYASSTVWFIVGLILLGIAVLKIESPLIVLTFNNKATPEIIQQTMENQVRKISPTVSPIPQQSPVSTQSLKTDETYEILDGPPLPGYWCSSCNEQKKRVKRNKVKGSYVQEQVPCPDCGQPLLQFWLPKNRTIYLVFVLATSFFIAGIVASLAISMFDFSLNEIIIISGTSIGYVIIGGIGSFIYFRKWLKIDVLPKSASYAGLPIGPEQYIKRNAIAMGLIMIVLTLLLVFGTLSIG